MSNAGPLKRTKTTTACSACQKRRSKCDGAVPCVACRTHRTDCVKNEDEDGRRNMIFKRKIWELEGDRRLLNSLTSALCIAQPDQVRSLICLLRSNVPRHDIEAYLDEIFTNVDDNMQIDADTKSAVSDNPPPLSRRHRYRTGHIQDLMNPPVLVPAKPWTSVTEDDDFVSHLISLWFTWAHPWWHWVDEALFLEAMKAGDLSSPLCTPYLVNMILADSCLLNSWEPDEPMSDMMLHNQFYAEGKKLLEAEEGRVSLALVQAMGVQWTYLNTNGQDNLGNPVLNQQSFMAKDLDKWRVRLDSHGRLSQGTLSKVDQSLNRLSWALYAVNSFTLMSFPKARQWDVPHRSKPAYNHDSTFQEGWIPYPKQRSPKVNFHAECHFSALLSLAERACDEEAVFLGQHGKWSGHPTDDFLRLFDEFRRWPETLPECMKLSEGAMPHICALHAVHHWAVLILSKQAAAADSQHATRPTITTTTGSNEQHDWRSISISAAVAIGRLMESLCVDWGTNHFPVIIVQPVALALLTLLEDLGPEPNSSAFISLCITLRAASRRFRVARGVLLKVRDMAERNEVALPKETEHLLSVRGTETETKQNFMLESENIGLDYLLEKWVDLAL